MHVLPGGDVHQYRVLLLHLLFGYRSRNVSMRVSRSRCLSMVSITARKLRCRHTGVSSGTVVSSGIAMFSMLAVAMAKLGLVVAKDLVGLLLRSKVARNSMIF